MRFFVAKIVLMGVAILLAAGMGACGGGGSDSDTSSSSSSSSSSSGSSATVGDWNISTGENSADDMPSSGFSTISIALDTLAVTSSSSSLVVGTTSSGVTPVTLNGTTVITVTEETYGITITSTATSDTPINFALSGAYTHTVTFYSDNDFKLTLSAAAIASSNGPAINIQSGQRAFVVLAGASTLSDGSSYTTRYLADGTTEMDIKSALFSEGPLLFSGSGSLTASSSKKHVVCSDAHVRITEGTLSLTASKKDGIHINDAFIMDGGSLTVSTSVGKGIKVEGKEDDTAPIGFIAINDGTINITSYDKAITAAWEGDEDGETTTTADDPDPRVTINGGTIAITTTGTPYEDTDTSDGDDSLAPEGIEAKSTLTVNAGTIEITATDDAINAGTGIAFNGGYVYARSSTNDAIDSNGTMSIAGGVVVADGASGAEGGLDCDQNAFTISGGTFVGIGGRNSTPTSVSQNTVSLRNVSSGLLTLKDSSGNVAFAFTMPETSAAVLLGSSSLTTGTRYTVYSGGGSIGSYSSLFHGLYSGASSHSGGTTGSSFTISSTMTSL